MELKDLLAVTAPHTQLEIWDRQAPDELLFNSRVKVVYFGRAGDYDRDEGKRVIEIDVVNHILKVRLEKPE